MQQDQYRAFRWPGRRLRLPRITPSL